MTDNNKKIELGWQFLRYYSLVRLVIALFFVASPFIIGDKSDYHNFQLFQSVAISYLILASLLLFIALSEQRFQLMSVVQPLVDIGILGLLAYLGHSNTSGYAVLMAIVSIFALLLLRHRLALLYGVGAALLLFLVHWLRANEISDSAYLDLSLQAFAILTVSLLANSLARRLTNYESEVMEHSHSIQDMHQLNRDIINTMNRGFIVIDSEQHTLYMNKIAWYYFGNPANALSQELGSFAPELTQQIKASNKDEFEGQLFKANNNGPRILPRFQKLANKDRTLIILEDYSEISKRIQQAKLASLGQLTASIAHEIRNPLSAINQASQMFEEFESNTQQEKDLLQIIQRQSKRINNIIENVQMVSKRKMPSRNELVLERFLPSFIHEFKQGLNFDAEILCENIDENLSIRFDQSQLKQVLSNLFENGLKYSFINTKRYRLHITATQDKITKQQFLDIIDEGVGISVEESEKIFEPFYTTNHDGTGLGLYISRELCEANGAQLECIPVAFGGACFRIIFDNRP
ncbi:nitrogen regulation protein NR(II) [Kangiella sp. TOML190]|uniref:two-component system sensor histidine kinase NtrB n=1 Tax=Kangiella sp. TOML190 TaxID=2931351 RepID=UPI00203E421F|nr:ATP-binding protein [Kangiella sp. TOML190]